MLSYFVRYKDTIKMNIFVAQPGYELAVSKFFALVLRAKADRAFNVRMKVKGDLHE